MADSPKRRTPVLFISYSHADREETIRVEELFRSISKALEGWVDDSSQKPIVDDTKPPLLERFMLGDRRLVEDITREHLTLRWADDFSCRAPVRKVEDQSPQTLDAMVGRATEVIGDKDRALRWMGTPIRGLGFATPISLLGTPEGVEKVYDILGQMEHGVW